MGLCPAGPVVASHPHHRHGRCRQSRRPLRTLIIPISTERDCRQHQLFNFGRPDVAHPFYNLGPCVSYRNRRDVHGEYNRKRPRRRHLRPYHDHLHRFRHRPDRHDRDGDAQRQSASSASHPRWKHCHRRQSSRTLRPLIIPISTKRDRRQHQLFSFRLPELAYPVLDLGHCVSFRNRRRRRRG
jgi:hypothetical protein